MANLSTSDLARMGLTVAGGKLVKGTEPPKKVRAKRFTGRFSRRKAWIVEMMSLPGIFSPMKTCTETNTGGTHWAKAGRAKKQAEEVLTLLREAGCRWDYRPTAIQFTRYSPKTMDEWENLRSAFKFVKDAICYFYDVDDAEAKCPFVFLPPKQEKAPFIGIRIELTRKD